MEKSVSGWDAQPPSDYHSTAYLLNRLNFPVPTWCLIVELLGNGVPESVVDRGFLCIIYIVELGKALVAKEQRYGRSLSFLCPSLLG